MENLPLELWLNIFERLSLVDLRNCKLVNKKWYKVAKVEVRIKELSLNDGKSRSNDGELVENMIDVGAKKSSFLSFLEFKNEKPEKLRRFETLWNLKFLEHLMIDCKSENDFKIDYLNKFENLKRFEFTIYKNYNYGKLSLPNLQIIKIIFSENAAKGTWYWASNFKENFQIDSPELNVVSCRYLPTVHRPDTVRHLEVYLLSEDVFIFRNLSHLRVNSTNQINILGNLPNLIEIKYTMKYDSRTICNIRHQIKELIEKREKQKRKLNIYFQNILVTDVRQLNDFRLED